jgi:hypothetical protein
MVGPVGVRRRLGLWRPWLWFVLLALVVAAYVLAVVYVHPRSWPLWKKLVDSLRIFPSGFPGYETSQPWQYNLARYLAAFVFLLASFRLLAIAFSDRLAELRAWFRRGHVVVCGLGDTGRRSVRVFLADGSRVTCLDADNAGDGTAEARARGALVLKRDATQLASLGSARADTARSVVCSCSDDATNTRVATLVAATAALAKAHDGPDVYVRIENPDLAELLRGRLPAVGPTVFHFFSAAAVWARAMLDDPRSPFAHGTLDPSRVVVLGNTELGRAVAVGAARRWHARVRSGSAAGRARISLCGAGAPAACASLVERFPAIPRVCDLEGVEHAPDATFPHELDGQIGDPGPAAVYVCVDDPGDRLAAAFDAVRHVDRDSAVLVPAVAAAVVAPLASAEQIHVVDLSQVASVDLIHDLMRDRFAREAHAVWLEQRRRADDFGSQASDRPWEELPDDYRRANYAHIQGMSEQLQAVWYEIEQLADWDDEPEELSDASVEAMAELEHLRWCRERRAAGWRYAEARDDRRRRHPLLVSWAELSEEKRDLDRELVRRRPEMLARAGYRLVRNPARERLAALRHEHYRRGEAAQGNPDVPPWRELDEAVRESNRAAIDHIAVKLARIDWRAIPAALGFGRPVVFTEAEIEELAELEHERWMKEHLAAGWARGRRDDDAQTHPSLVPWDDLDEPEKEKDREVVRAIPELLEAAGLTIARDSD